MHHPILYEINTRCWLRELAEKTGQTITLATIPASEFARWQRLGFTHIWLMGVWSSGQRARAEAFRRPEQHSHYTRALPDWTEADIAGSPYAIADYQVPAALGGETGLRAFRRQLHSHGLKLLLDFVPNHLGLDHPWIGEQTDLFVQSPVEFPETFGLNTSGGTRWLAHGKDPNFPAWTDTVQLDYRRLATRAAMMSLLQSLAERCDGVRCDMAMLLLNDVFQKTWRHCPVTHHASGIIDSDATVPEFWAAAIEMTKRAQPGFLFLAEAYWGLESRLQALGFDYTYDKELYDRLIARDGPGVQRHLLGKTPEFIAASAHFLENHDEPRIASILSVAEHRPAALLILGLPGMRFLHEGQLEGVRAKIPVQLLRRPVEPDHIAIKQLYEQLLTALLGTAAGQGRGEVLAPRAAWPENPTAENFIVVQWQTEAAEFDLVVMNLAPHRSQCYAPLTIRHLPASNWMFKDLLSEEEFSRSGDDLQNQGLYLDLPAHGAQLFHCYPTA